jgi:hypothetical protein
MIKLYRFERYHGRNGTVESLFFATPAAVQAAIGLEVSFGDILGKHSDISIDLEATDITEVKIPEGWVLALSEIREFIEVGHNPLKFLLCRDCGNSCVFDCDYWFCRTCEEDDDEGRDPTEDAEQL